MTPSPNDYSTLTARFKHDARVRIIEGEGMIEKLLPAVDVAIMKASRHATLLQLGMLGTPVIVLSIANNPMNDLKARVQPHVTFLRLLEADPERLAHQISTAGGALRKPVNLRPGMGEATEAIDRFLGRLARGNS